MSLLVEDCPRCGAKNITFDVGAQVYCGQEYNWQKWYEIFCTCRHCSRPTIFLVGLSEYNAQNVFYINDGLVKYTGSLNPFFTVKRFISIRDNNTEKPPEHLPKEIEEAFSEGATCLAVGCNNAAGAMFRLCIDLATRPLLPSEEDTTKSQPNSKIRRDLGLRLAWLFDQNILPITLKELAKCIREDGNDGAHAGNLTEEDAHDLLDFSFTLLERLFTEPKKLELAEERRVKRRKTGSKGSA